MGNNFQDASEVGRAESASLAGGPIGGAALPTGGPCGMVASDEADSNGEIGTTRGRPVWSGRGPR